MLNVHEKTKTAESPKSDDSVLLREDIYKILITALTEKLPLPPSDWCASQLDEELRKATHEFEQNAILRQSDALETSLCFLVDFARRMPEWLDLSELNPRIEGMCLELSVEIEKIALLPESIIAERGKLKTWLKAILAVYPCFIYSEGLARRIADREEREKVKPLQEPTKSKKRVLTRSEKHLGSKWQSELAKTIFQKAREGQRESDTNQPTLF